MDERVGCKIDKEKIDYELDDLDSGYPFLPPDSNATGCLEVVPIHDNMDSQVESDWNITLNTNKTVQVNEECTTGV